jgi:beta-galactosidase GanA
VRADGEREFVFLINHTDQPRTVEEPSGPVQLGPYDVRVLRALDR